MVKVLIMSGYGINCEKESAHAFEKAGAEAEIVHINDLISGKKKMSEYDIMMFPGGFSYGDDTGSGNAFANKMRNNLWDDLIDFIKAEKLILGVCNGFQIMTHLGLFSLPIGDYGQRIHSMESNTSHRYECRWVNIKHNNSNCVFTKDIELTHLPVAHGEGRYYADDDTLKKMRLNDQILFRYCDENGVISEEANPNGSIENIAGVCNENKNVFGMMPHPERAADIELGNIDGKAIFESILSMIHA